MINFFSKNKFIFYLCNMILIFLYLFPGSVLGWFLYNDLSLQPQITPDFIISTNHVYAFLIISTIGLLTFNISNQFIYISLYLIFLSLALEVAHYFIPKRSFEFTDLFGNLLGVIIVLILFYFFKKNENSKT
ncbi:VanZ family protein [Candidatus Pelagibacter ubique]|uniref:VanZ family protein n=1 Tax=Pelagibacter ubique TaxID=198252 RepID=UPI0003D1B3FF